MSKPGFFFCYWCHFPCGFINENGRNAYFNERRGNCKQKLFTWINARYNICTLRLYTAKPYHLSNIIIIIIIEIFLKFVFMCFIPVSRV